MNTVTLTSKGQLTIPRPLRDALGLAPGARLQASIDRQGRLVLVPSKYEPEELFRHRPRVSRRLSLEEMDQGIANAASASGR
jgi:AbrB family looped-hinge helix DNA binding protein